MAKKTKGKGVDALFAEEQAAKAKGEAKRERDARKKREKRAADRAAREANGFPPGPREVKPSASTHTEGGAFDPDPPVRVVTPEQFDKIKEVLDEDQPVPVRLTFVAIAHAFDEACEVTTQKQAELDDAVRKQAAAKKALDQAIARRAEGERA